MIWRINKNKKKKKNLKAIYYLIDFVRTFEWFSQMLFMGRFYHLYLDLNISISQINVEFQVRFQFQRKNDSETEFKS